MTEDDSESPEGTMSSTKKKVLGFFFNLLLFLLLVAGVLFLQWFGWGWIESNIPKEDRGPFGDMFGSINTLFSGLAFAGIIFTILLQSRELALQREELKGTKVELKLSREAHQKNSAIMDQQLEILKKNAEIEQARYVQEMYPIFVDEGPVSNYSSEIPNEHCLKISNKGKPIRNMQIEGHVPDSNLTIKSGFIPYFGKDEDFRFYYLYDNYVQGGNNECEQTGDIRFWTQDDKRWEMSIILKYLEGDPPQIEFGFIRKYEGK